MRATRTEQALRRILAWLSWAGWELTPPLEQAALQALAEAVAAGEVDLFGASLQRLRRGGALNGAEVDRIADNCPVLTPPIRRSSIGYGRY
ncbi:MAG: hypothetical protein WC953_00555 [Pseudomonas sp.]